MILAVAGPSGVGKSRHLEIGARRCGYTRPVATTTRAKRRDETEGRDYFFVSRPAFRRGIRERRFVDWDYTIGNYYGYGIELADTPVHASAIVAVTARVGIRLALRLPDVYLLFLDGKDRTMDERLRQRGVPHLEVLLRHEHRQEERQHSPLFHQRIKDADETSEDGIAAYLLALRSRYPG